MRLLIHHDQALELQKLRHRQVFGKIPGELCVWSINISIQATRLCLALRRVAGLLPPDDRRRIGGVLQAAGRYALVLDESSAMAPTVVADIEMRDLLKPWDRLAIVANCCQYPVRLDGEALSRQHRSLSLSILAMCLLNGEILDNSEHGKKSVAELTTSEFFKRQMFRSFSAPEDETRRLTFNKGCRLTDVELTTGGIVARGHVWKLGRVIDTAKFRRRLPRIDKPRGRLTLGQRKRLLQLVFRLCDLVYRQLAGRVDEYLATDANADAGKGYASFTEMYLHRMAVELATTIRARRRLRLGSIWDTTGRWINYSAIFVWPDGGGKGACQAPPAFAFTSAWQGNPGSQTQDANDIDRHVSIKVNLEGPLCADGLPHLRVCSWLLGMCFFDGYPRTGVVFPWPRALQAVRP